MGGGEVIGGAFAKKECFNNAEAVFRLIGSFCKQQRTKSLKLSENSPSKTGDGF